MAILTNSYTYQYEEDLDTYAIYLELHKFGTGSIFYEKPVTFEQMFGYTMSKSKKGKIIIEGSEIAKNRALLLTHSYKIL